MHQQDVAGAHAQRGQCGGQPLTIERGRVGKDRVGRRCVGRGCVGRGAHGGDPCPCRAAPMRAAAMPGAPHTLTPAAPPHPSRGISIAGHRSMTISSPAARVRSYASSSTTPSWNQTAFAPPPPPRPRPARQLAVDEHVHHVHRERDVRQRGVPLLPVHRLRLGVHRHDPLAEALEDLRHPVGGAGAVGGEAHHRPGVARLLKNPPDRLCLVVHAGTTAGSGPVIPAGTRGRRGA